MRIFGLAAAFAALLPFAASAQETVHLEAKDAKLSGPNLHLVAPDAKPGVTPPDFAESGYITGFQAPEDQAEFTFRLKSAGVYTVSIGYRCNGQKGLEMEVNGLAIGGTVQPTANGQFERQTIARVDLAEGSNTVVLHKGWGFYEVDYLELKPAKPAPPRVPPAQTLSDPQLTPEARALFARLQASYGKTTMLGVYSQADADYVFDTAGVRPAIMGGDLLAYSPQEVAHGSHPEKADEVGRLIAAAKAGQTITLSWHWCSPTGLIDSKEKPRWRGFYTDSTTFDIQKTLADPSSADYAAMLSDIDAIAVQLRKLQDAHVPVLWRPLHEASGRWFWWGAKGPEPFVQLWRILFDRLTRVDGVHNLIWVFTGDADLAWYPGDEVVDLVGIDAYPKDLRDPQTQLWDDLARSLGQRKLLTISEFGGVPDVPAMQRLGEFWSYAVSWSGKEGPKKNSPEDVKRIYTSSGTALPAAPPPPERPPAPAVP
jgi:mannan endo-1,4-beta-mannosidase